MFQLDWVIGCPGIWSNFILGVLLRVFLNENNISAGRMNEVEMSLPSNGQTLSNEFKTLNRTKTE